MKVERVWVIPIGCAVVFVADLAVRLLLGEQRAYDYVDPDTTAQGILIALVLNYHFFGVGNRLVVSLATLCGIVAILQLFYTYSGWGRSDLPLSKAALSLLVYGVMLFTMFSDFLLGGLAQFLTRTRGEQWVKELDYLYLTLGALGIVGTLNRVDVVGGKLAEQYDIVGPLLIASAIVVRIIKTRAEIGEWNKASKSPTMTSRPSSSTAA
jgi:hypothetical protein